MTVLIDALSVSLDYHVLIAMAIGTIIGLIFGAIPGLTYTVALAIVLPMTFTLGPAASIAMMLGTFNGGMAGGAISAILIGIPGTPSSAATVADGYAMTRAGKASLALGASIVASTFGGLFSLIVMMVSVNLVARLAIKFGPAEIFALVLFGLSTICAMAERSLLRGLIAGAIGLMVMTIGLDSIDGAQRLTFGFTDMLQGVNLVVAMVGLFAVPHVIETFLSYFRGERQAVSASAVRVELPSWRSIRSQLWLMVRTSSIGTVIGAIPGAHGPVAAFLGYDHARRFSRHPERFGHGAIEGVVAPEASHNAVTGGAMIPLLSLGIPGDPATAIILSGLLIHGLTPGPLLFSQHPAEVYSVYLSFITSHIVIIIVWLLGIRAFVQVLRVPAHYLAIDHRRNVRDRLLRGAQQRLRCLHHGDHRGARLRAAAGAHPLDADRAGPRARADAGEGVPHRDDAVGRRSVDLLHIAGGDGAVRARAVRRARPALEHDEDARAGQGRERRAQCQTPTQLKPPRRPRCAGVPGDRQGRRSRRRRWLRGELDPLIRTTLSEALVLGLLRQGVRKYFAIFGHGSTDLGNVLRVYEEAGVTRTINCRNEVEMAHAATALAWTYGETPAVVTSIGPGALQAMAGSLAAASNGVGVYHIYGDETTRGEGYNMQQIPKREQGLFARVTALMGQSYELHTPGALRDACAAGRGACITPIRPGRSICCCRSTPSRELTEVNLAPLPERLKVPALVPQGDEALDEAVALIAKHEKIVIKAGGGTRGADSAVRQLAERIGAAVVLSPGSTGVLPDAHPQNMHVGGSKGSISGNYAMENATLLIAIGTRAVCQADCSGVGYPNAEAVININGDLGDLMHYAGTVGLPGDISAVIGRLLAAVARSNSVDPTKKAEWLAACATKKQEWAAFKKDRFETAPIHDPVWGRLILPQPAAIKVVADFAKSIGAVKFFDAGDVQANGFQIVEDDKTGDTYTESGASYMGFAVSALLASALAEKPRYGIAFTGDGSFMMNPQILIDGIEHGVKGMIVVFDNRRMAAITGLQKAQYNAEFATSDKVAVDYVQLATAVKGVKAFWGGTTAGALAGALEEAREHDGLSLVHVPVYAGDHPFGGMGAYGSWNVGNWVADVQARYLKQKI